jgi:PilZ domain
MVPVLPEVSDLDPESAADPWADRRADDRWPARPGTQFEVRQDDRGPDLAVALVDLSATGLRAAVRGPLVVGEQVVARLAPPHDGWAFRAQAVVCWRVEGAEGTALAGLQFRTPLPPLLVADLAAPDLG